MSAKLWIHSLAALALLPASVGRTAASTCASPIGVDPFPTAGNCAYDVVLNDRMGSFSAGTGVEHPVTVALRPITPLWGGRQTLPLGGGNSLIAEERGVSIRSWTSRDDYPFDHLAAMASDRGFACLAGWGWAPLVTEVIRADGQVIGLQARSDVEHAGDHLGVTIRIVARGQSFEDSAVELTTEVQNLGGTEARVGLRYLWNVGMAGGGGIALGPVPPDPPTEPWASGDGEWATPGFDHLVASWTNAPSTFNPYYLGGISVNGPWTLAPPPTPPDVIVSSADLSGSTLRDGPANTCFAWEAPVPPRGGTVRPGAGGMEALAYYWGRTEDTAIHLAPGESRSFTVWFWAFLDNPVTCDAGPARQVVECTGPSTPVVLDGSDSHTAEGNALRFRWSSPDPAVAFDDTTAERPTAYLPGVGIHSIKLEAGIGPFTKACQTDVEVVDTTPPVLRALSVEPSILWPPNHRLVGVRVHAEVDDVCDAAPEVRLVAVTSNEPDDAIGLGDGRTVDDIQRAEFGQDDRDLMLRAERDGQGGGRTYTLTYEARDASGNTASQSVVVSVPHDMRGRAALPVQSSTHPRRR